MFGLTPDNIRKIKEAFAQFPAIEKVILYGSRAKGNYKDGSDIDITLLGNNLSLKIIYALETALEDLYLPYTFDISLFTQIDNPDLIQHILEMGKTLYVKEDSQLPKGWEVKKLEEVCEIRSGRDYKKVIEPDGQYPIIGSAGKPMGYTNQYICEEETTIIGRKGTINSPIFINTKFWNVDTAFGLHALEVLDKKFLYLFCLSFDFRTLDKGSGRPSLVKTDLKKIPTPIPPLPEQKRIVAKLDKAFADIDQAQSKAQRNLENAKELFESYLQDIFVNGQLKVESGEWETCELNDYVNFIDYRGRTPVKTTSGVRLITAKNIKLGHLQQKPEEFIAVDNYESWMTRGIPNFGDIIFTTEAPLAHIAQINTKEKLAFAQRVIVMQPNPQKINQTFLKYLLLSNPIRNKIIAQGTGATVLGIKSRLLKKIEISFPKAIDEQTRIIKELDNLSSECKRLELIYKEKLSNLAELKKSILDKAFKGELSN